jgi:four helix bundle protein
MASRADELAARVKVFADRVLKFVCSLPQDQRIEHIFVQLIDSASAESANYRAARRARSRKEFVARLGLVAEEADESENWLDVLTTAGIVTTAARIAELRDLLTEARELRAIFVQSHQTARANYERMSDRNRRKKTQPPHREESDP